MRQVDARGTRCPMPVIALARAASDGRATRVELLADDPVSLTDVPAWCRMRGARLVSVERRADHWSFVIDPAPTPRAGPAAPEASEGTPPD